MVREMRYLKYTLNYGLHYTRYPFVLREYNDVNRIFVTKDTKSMSGYVFKFGGLDVSWTSTKQTYIARSTIELILIYLDYVREEAKWLHYFL
jgi:hypothetical protein